MVDKIEKFWNQYYEIINYLIFGVATTLVNWVSFSFLMHETHLPLTINNAISWFLSVIFAYITNKLWVFNSKSWKIHTVWKEMGLFFCARILSGAVEMIVVPMLVYIGINKILFGVEGFEAKIITSVIVIVLNFIFSKLFIFKKDERKVI